MNQTSSDEELYVLIQNGYGKEKALRVYLLIIKDYYQTLVITICGI